MARLPRVMGRGRALEVLLSADDIRGSDAELLGYVNRALPDAELHNFVDALATRIALGGVGLLVTAVCPRPPACDGRPSRSTPAVARDLIAAMTSTRQTG